MFTAHRLVAIGLAALLAGCASAPKHPIARPDLAWEETFEHPVAFHKLIGNDLLVVGTTRHLYGIDPVTGAQVWRQRNINAGSADIIDLADAPYFLVNDAAGGAYDDAGSHVLAIDRYDGSIHWESAVIPGRILQARIDYQRYRLYAAAVRGAHGDDRGLFSDLLPGKGLFSGFERTPELLAIDLHDGTVLWHQTFGEEVPMRPSYRAGVSELRPHEYQIPFDLGLFHPPTLVDDMVCVTYDGVHCYDADSGRLKWGDRFDVIDDDLALSYPEPVVDDDLLIVGDTDRLFGLEPASGDRRWRSEKFGRAPDLLEDENVVYLQIGGRFFDLEKEEWDAKGGFGVAAVNKRNGRTLWEYTRVRRSITNLLSAGPHIWFADHETLFALDRLDGTVVVRESHRLGQPPNFIALTTADRITLVSESEVAGYRATDGAILWYERFPPVGPGAWKTIAAGIMRASGAIFRLSSTLLNYGGSLVSIPSINVAGTSVRGKSIAEDATGYLGEKLSEKGEAVGAETAYARLTGRSQYFLTRPAGQKDVMLAAIDLASGKTRRLTVLPSQTASLVIDEINSRAYQADGYTLAAVPLGQ